MKAKYEKVNGNTVKIIIEKSSDVPIEQLIANKKKIEENIANEEKLLAEGGIEKQIRANIEKAKETIKENEETIKNRTEEQKVEDNIKVEKEILKNIDEMLEACKKLGIAPKPIEPPKTEKK